MSKLKTRVCECDSHQYPLCACFEGVKGDALLRRSNHLSSIAGWPGELDPALVSEHLKRAALGFKALKAKAKARDAARAEQLRARLAQEWAVQKAESEAQGITFAIPEPVPGPAPLRARTQARPTPTPRPLAVGEAGAGCGSCNSPQDSTHA